MEMLSCKTPAMAEKELWVYLLAYNLIRLLMVQAALASDRLPRELSFKHTLQLWLAWSQRGTGSGHRHPLSVLFVLICSTESGRSPGTYRTESRQTTAQALSFAHPAKSDGQGEHPASWAPREA
jgi:hypothetical protein